MAEVFKFPVKLELILLYLTSATIAQNITQPSQSEGNGLVGWQSNPAQRGTTNILESCILTIIACTWTIHHPNVPSQKPKTMLGNFLHHLKWMTFTILVPEFILAQALDERLWVSRNWSILKRNNAKLDKHFASQRRPFDLTYEENRGWSKKHLHFANMGGFRIDLMSNTRSRNKATAIFPLTSGELIQYLEVEDSQSDQSPAIPEPTTTESTTTEPTRTESTTAKPTTTEPTTAKAPEFGEAPISVAHIDRMVKREAIVKTIAFLQILWILLSAIARAYLHHPISQLEIMTVAFATCAVITYIIRWNKPQNVEIWIELPSTYKDLRELYEPYRFFDLIKDRKPNGDWKSRRPYFRNDTLRPSHVNRTFLPCLILFMVIIGLLHVIAWNFSFPSNVEKVMWRVASVASAGIPPLLLICSSFVSWLFVWVGDSFVSKGERDMPPEPKHFKNFCICILKEAKNEADDEIKKIEEREETRNTRSKTSTEARKATEATEAMEAREKKELEKVKEAMEAMEARKKKELEKVKEAMENSQKLLNGPECYLKIFSLPVLERMITFVGMNWNGLYSGDFGSTFQLDKIDFFSDRLEELKDHLDKQGSIQQEILTSYDDNYYKVDTFPRKTAKWRRREMSDNISRVAMPFIMVFYTLARLIIIALAFSCLRAMPAGVYETTWTNYLPKLD
ncbi:hypothetical protein K445DRAFT_317638 [Daldinia sp. EC12]|nr:hypothetical protein K445DRAFT_317638 [Daldinia sp. EC12]